MCGYTSVSQPIKTHECPIQEEIPCINIHEVPSQAEQNNVNDNASKKVNSEL